MLGPCAWLRNYGSTRLSPDVRMVCFPHAGGTASAYAGWRAGLGCSAELIAVRYPAREDRLCEPPVRSLRVAARMIAGDLRQLHAERPLPLVLFGHSMGASIAHEVAVLLREAAIPVVLLLVSARLPVAAIRPGRRKSDEELAAMLCDMDPVTGEVLSDPELRALVWPAIRADYDATNRYHGHRLPRLDVPIVALGGRSDDRVSRDALTSWQECTTAGCRIQLFEGGHFYYRKDLESFLAVISTYVSDAVDVLCRSEGRRGMSMCPVA